MRKCSNTQCNNLIPLRIKIDGKIRHLQNRKYCLTCSPFGEHNTKPYGYVRMSASGRTCKVCNKNYKQKGFICPSCLSNYRRFEVKRKAVEYLGGKCQRCGYSQCIAALTFHHRNPKDKEFGIGGNHCLAFHKIKKELDKCDLLCQNCHSELHWNENIELRQKVERNIKEMKNLILVP